MTGVAIRCAVLAAAMLVGAGVTVWLLLRAVERLLS